MISSKRRTVDFICYVDRHTPLIRHIKTGVAIIEKDGKYYSHHSLIKSNESVSKMKKDKQWGSSDLVVRNVYGHNVNISKIHISSLYEIITSLVCQCSECMQSQYSNARKHLLRIVYDNIKSFKICPACLKVSCLFIDNHLMAADGLKLSIDEATAFTILKEGNGTWFFIGRLFQVATTCCECISKKHQDGCRCTDCLIGDNDDALKARCATCRNWKGDKTAIVQMFNDAHDKEEFLNPVTTNCNVFGTCLSFPRYSNDIFKPIGVFGCIFHEKGV